MTLYEFNALDLEGRLRAVYSDAIHLDSLVDNGERIACYALGMFFVELVYDEENNTIGEARAFKHGHRLDKYSSFKI